MEKINDAELMRKISKFTRKVRRQRMGGEMGRDPRGMAPDPAFGRGFPPGWKGGWGQPGMGMPDRMGMHPAGKPGKHGKHRRALSRERLLVVINKHPDGIRQKAIAEKLGINQSSTSELINRLESDGYLERRVDPDDKRATLLFLTEKGAARAAEVEDERAAKFKDVFAVLTEEEKQILSGLMDKLLEGMKQEEADSAKD